MEGGGFTVVPDMMSIVGCSGEDFQNILTSLGYRSQIRKHAKPVEALNQSRRPLNQILKLLNHPLKQLKSMTRSSG